MSSVYVSYTLKDILLVCLFAIYVYTYVLYIRIRNFPVGVYVRMYICRYAPEFLICTYVRTYICTYVCEHTFSVSICPQVHTYVHTVCMLGVSNFPQPCR